MRRRLLGMVALSAAALVTIGWKSPDPPPAGKLIVVKMVDVSATEYKFEPSVVTASPGDTVRFEQTAAMPHNVAFRNPPASAKLGGAAEGPYLTAAGEKYDLVIDGRFAAGVYQFVCTPHETMGMTGKLTIIAKK